MIIITSIIFILCLILLAQSLLALVSGIGLARYARRHSTRRQLEYQPKAAVLVPCRGIDLEFEENLRPLFLQNYGEYEIVFITENDQDPAYRVIAQMIEKSSRPAWLIVAGESKDRGQKIHNLCAGIEMLNTIDRRTEVLVFVDADARPGKDWLAELVAPLGDKRIGATTGFRWFVPAGRRGIGGWLGKLLPSILLAVWNAGALALLGERSRFAWGGSMAIRRENFDRLRILRRWDGALSDDYMLTGAVNEARQKIRFIPGALVRSPLRTTWKGLFEFTTRQIRITRVYSPTVWQFGLANYFFYNMVFLGGLVLLATGTGGSRQTALALTLLTIYLLGAINGAIRAVVATQLIARSSVNEKGSPWSGRNGLLVSCHALLNPVISLLYLYNFFASLTSRRIVWRGITYEMISPMKTIREVSGSSSRR